MFDSQCDLAALVYDPSEYPDEVLRGFAADLAERGYRAVGLVQCGHHRVDAPDMPVTLQQNGEKLELHRHGGATGCRLDVDQLQQAGARVTLAIDAGADLVIVNRFGRQELQGKGLCRLIEHAVDADMPVIVAVPQHRFSDWIRFADGMSVKLPCRRGALEAWWDAVSGRVSGKLQPAQGTVCEVLK